MESPAAVISLGTYRGNGQRRRRAKTQLHSPFHLTSSPRRELSRVGVVQNTQWPRAGKLNLRPQRPFPSCLLRNHFPHHTPTQCGGKAVVPFPMLCPSLSPTSRCLSTITLCIWVSQATSLCCGGVSLCDHTDFQVPSLCAPCPQYTSLDLHATLEARYTQKQLRAQPNG